MSVSAITFDFHDTLAECDQWFQLEIRGLVPAFLDWYTHHVGAAPTSAEVKRTGIAEYRTIREQVMADGIEQDAVTCLRMVLERLEHSIEPTLVDQGLEAIMRETLTEAIPKPGAIEVVRHIAAAGVPMAIISSAVYHPFLEWSLEKFGILDCFELIVTSAWSGHYKSTTKIYTYTLQRLGAAPDESIHVGDSVRFDVTTAHRAGLRTVWVDWNGTAANGHQADLVVPTLHGLGPRLLTEF